jgi:uncharacterized repeat protein (TIGR03803 family)
LIFAVSPKKSGSERVLFNFDGKNGFQPVGGLVVDPKGDLYGATSGGGAYANGTVFEIRP